MVASSDEDRLNDALEDVYSGNASTSASTVWWTRIDVPSSGRSTMTSDERLSATIGAIYDCVTAPEKWEGVLHQLCNELCFATGALAVGGMSNGQAAILASVGFTPEWLARAPEYDADT